MKLHQDTGPVGSGGYKIRESDCILSVAFEHGLHWETLWNHPDNVEVKKRRKYPEMILPGDRLTIPPIERGEVEAAPETRHRFMRKGVPAKVRLRFVLEEPADEQEPMGGKVANPDDLHASSEDEDPLPPPPVEPRDDVPYWLVIDGKTTEGRTDSNGEVSFFIPPNAQSGKIVLEPGAENETTFTLGLGRLGPLTEVRGIQQRLTNLGIAAGELSDEWTPELEEAVRDFQTRHELEVTGEVDAPTRDKLEEMHGS